MDSITTTESKLKHLDLEMKVACFAVIAVAVIVLVFSVASCFLFWRYRWDVKSDDYEFDAVLHALRVVLFAFLPAIGIFFLAVGFRILCLLRKRRVLLKDDYNA